MGEFPEDSDGLVWREAVLAQGHTDDVIKRAIAAKRLLRIWPGVYAVASRGRNIDQLRRLRVIAAVRSCSEPMVASHQSAALMHHLPLLKPGYAKVHLNTGRDGGGRIEKRRHLHTGTLSADDVIRSGRILVTSIGRTAVDCARAGSFDGGVVAFDSALRMGANRVVMMTQLEQIRGSRGVSRALRALDVADALSESVGESWSRAQMLACPDLRKPTLQRKFYDSNGRFVARVDFEWQGRLVAEFDGLMKYGAGSMLPGQTPNDVVIAEKIREDRLRQLGLEVVRWVWDDLEAGRLPGILRQAMVRAGLS
ncbi:hypothetical protein [Gordonia rubripertincta]|uniref:Type IV toxin-antitoxin system AbiEi family antitoxin domain-containing protein n=1 Tax=Gordonia rubripertincta TaxID=36822 RepID=A0ABT4MXY4_GORRU|nr:hypothetical protein [Gordonia rubripertincta]MCZ4551873.1 hypothetical protein [Gordonia rubripertincta]